MVEPTLCLCAEEISTAAIYPCKHVICPTCCLRLRALMDDKTCPYCRDVAVEQVSIVRNSSVKAVKAQIPLKKFGIMCETKEILTSLEHHLNMACPVCDAEQLNRKQFKQHFHDKHQGKNYCRVCEQHEYVFADELEVYSSKGLSAHLKSEHATCPFCNWHFYSNKELNKHCKTQHEICFICERIDPSKPRYFENYLKLKDHFNAEHYMCMVPSCIEDKFIAFGSKIELQNHMLEQHKELVNVKEMRTVDLAGLNEIQSRQTASQEDTKASTMRRYTERLRIDSKNDSGVVDQILQANHTYETKKVPADVFIKTYESILTTTTSDEITILLDEFVRFTTLSTEKRKQLDLALARRRPEPTPTQTKKPSSSNISGPTTSQHFGAYGQWAGRRQNMGGGINHANLPKLGAGNPRATQPDILTRPPKISGPLRPTGLTSNTNLPKLTAQKKKQTLNQGPQIRLPSLGAPRSTRPVWMSADEWEPRSSQPSSARVSPSASNSSSPGLSPTPSASSRPNFGGLPTLPSVAPKKKSGKGAKVVRIV